jgi:hypothetical protein
MEEHSWGALIGSTAGEHEDSVSAACLLLSVPEALCIFFMRETFQGTPEDRNILLLASKTIEATKMGVLHAGLPKAVDLEDAQIPAAIGLWVGVRAPRPTGHHFSFFQDPRLTTQHAWQEPRSLFGVPLGREHSQVTGTKMGGPRGMESHSRRSGLLGYSLESNGDIDLGWRVGCCPVESSPVGCRGSWQAYWPSQLGDV